MRFDLVDKFKIFQCDEKSTDYMPVNLTPPFICSQLEKNKFKVYNKDNFTGKIPAQTQQ